MPRTTLNLDASVLQELKRRQRREGKPLGQLVSEILALALEDERQREGVEPFEWISQPMRARVDLDDREAVQALLDQS